MRSSQLLTQFVDLIPIETRKLVLERLGKINLSAETKVENPNGREPLPPTIIVEPGSQLSVADSKPEKKSSTRKTSPGCVNLVKLHARGSVGEVFVAFDDQLSRVCLT